MTKIVELTACTSMQQSSTKIPIDSGILVERHGAGIADLRSLAGCCPAARVEAPYRGVRLCAFGGKLARGGGHSPGVDFGSQRFLSLGVRAMWRIGLSRNVEPAPDARRDAEEAATRGIVERSRVFTSLSLSNLEK